MESTIGLFKTELIKKDEPWKSMADVELATADYIDWYNNTRLRTAIGGIPPSEHEAAYYAQTPDEAGANTEGSTKLGAVGGHGTRFGGRPPIPTVSRLRCRLRCQPLLPIEHHVRGRAAERRCLDKWARRGVLSSTLQEQQVPGGERLHDGSDQLTSGAWLPHEITLEIWERQFAVLDLIEQEG
jgi:Integrase core domain